MAEEAWRVRAKLQVIGHNYIGHDYIGHDYIGHNYIGDKYKGNGVCRRRLDGPGSAITM